MLIRKKKFLILLAFLLVGVYVPAKSPSFQKVMAAPFEEQIVLPQISELTAYYRKGSQGYVVDVGWMNTEKNNTAGGFNIYSKKSAASEWNKIRSVKSKPYEFFPDAQYWISDESDEVKRGEALEYKVVPYKLSGEVEQEMPEIAIKTTKAVETNGGNNINSSPQIVGITPQDFNAPWHHDDADGREILYRGHEIKIFNNENPDIYKVEIQRMKKSKGNWQPIDSKILTEEEIKSHETKLYTPPGGENIAFRARYKIGNKNGTWGLLGEIKKTKPITFAKRPGLTWEIYGSTIYTAIKGATAPFAIFYSDSEDAKYDIEDWDAVITPSHSNIGNSNKTIKIQDYGNRIMLRLASAVKTDEDKYYVAGLNQSNIISLKKRNISKKKFYVTSINRDAVSIYIPRTDREYRYKIYKNERWVRTLRAAGGELLYKAKNASKSQYRIRAFVDYSNMGGKYYGPLSNPVKPVENKVYFQNATSDYRKAKKGSLKFSRSSLKLVGADYQLRGYMLNNSKYSLRKIKKLNLKVYLNGKNVAKSYKKNVRLYVRRRSSKFTVFHIRGLSMKNLKIGRIRVSVDMKI